MALTHNELAMGMHVAGQVYTSCTFITARFWPAQNLTCGEFSILVFMHKQEEGGTGGILILKHMSRCNVHSRHHFCTVALGIHAL